MLCWHLGYKTEPIMGKKLQTLQTQSKEATGFFLDELEQGSPGPITVMICRRWDVNNINGRYMSTDFILSDQKGNVIHCIAKSNIAHCFINKLEEGSVYSLKDFIVHPNKDEYRIIKDGAYIIELQGSTVVSKTATEVGGFVRYPFQFVAFEALKPTDRKHFVDVIGYVAGLGKASRNTKGATTLDLNLINERGRQVRVTLWGKLGPELLEKKNQRSGVYSVILTSMTAKYYIGQLCLSSSSATLIIDNNDIPALKDFKVQISGVDLSEAIMPIIQLEPRLGTLAQLLNWGREKANDVATFRCEVKITHVRTKNSWYNFTCTSGKCRKGVSRKNGNFWCEACDTSVAFPRARFRLQLDVRDETTHTVIVCFDETAEKLVKTTAQALLDAQNEDTADDSVLPHCLESLIGSTHTFEVRSNTYYQYGEYESFNCARVISPGSEDQLLDVASASQLARNSEAPLSSLKSSKPIPPICTPSKSLEPKKRKICIYEDSESEAGVDEVMKESLAPVETPKKQRLYIEDSEIETDVN